MTATMKPNHALPHAFDVRCDQHGLDQRGLAYAHALEAMNTHNAEDHRDDDADPLDPETMFLSRAAVHVVEASARLWQADHTADDVRRLRTLLALWQDLTGLVDADALEYAKRLVESGEVTAHVAPF